MTTPEPVPLRIFAGRFPDAAALQGVANSQRRSTRGRLTKADAVLRHAAVLIDVGIQTRQDATAVITDLARFDAVNAEL